MLWYTNHIRKDFALSLDVCVTDKLNENHPITDHVPDESLV